MTQKKSTLPKPTPGPWEVDGRFVRSKSRKTLPICEIPSGGIIHSQRDAANARLIAAAPAMQNVLKRLRVKCGCRMMGCGPCAIIAVLNEVEGRS